jgi:hypothetical protein
MSRITDLPDNLAASPKVASGRPPDPATSAASVNTVASSQPRRRPADSKRTAAGSEVSVTVWNAAAASIPPHYERQFVIPTGSVIDDRDIDPTLDRSYRWIMPEGCHDLSATRR